MRARQFDNKSGFIALLAVLFLAAIGTGAGISLLILGLTSSQSSFSFESSFRARMLANACAEEALERLRESIYYTGNEVINFSLGSCQIMTISGTGNLNRTVQTTGSFGTVVRKVKVITTRIHPQILVTSWQEVADF